MSNTQVALPVEPGADMTLRDYLWLFQFALDHLKEKIADSENEVIRLERFIEEPYVPAASGPRSKRINSHMEFLISYRRIQRFTEHCIQRLQQESAEEFARSFKDYVTQREREEAGR